MTNSSPAGAFGVTRRTMVLAGIAVVLTSVLAFRELGLDDGTIGDGATARKQELVDRIAERSRYANAAASIRERYRANAFDYARQVASVRTLTTDRSQAPAEVAKSAVRDVITDGGPARDVRVTVAAPNDRGGGVHGALVTLEFVTPSDRHADRVVRNLGNPARGAVWTKLSVNAKPQDETVRVAGQLRTLVLESAE